MNPAEVGVPCILCGGTEGWWAAEVWAPCPRCGQTGQEPDGAVRDLIAGFGEPVQS